MITQSREASPRSFGASLSYYFSGAVIALVSKSTVLRGLAVVLLTRELKPIRNIRGGEVLDLGVCSGSPVRGGSLHL